MRSRRSRGKSSSLVPLQFKCPPVWNRCNPVVLGLKQNCRQLLSRPAFPSMKGSRRTQTYSTPMRHPSPSSKSRRQAGFTLLEIGHRPRHHRHAFGRCHLLESRYFRLIQNGPCGRGFSNHQFEFDAVQDRQWLLSHDPARTQGARGETFDKSGARPLVRHHEESSVGPLG